MYAPRKTVSFVLKTLNIPQGKVKGTKTDSFLQGQTLVLLNPATQNEKKKKLIKLFAWRWQANKFAAQTEVHKLSKCKSKVSDVVSLGS